MTKIHYRAIHFLAKHEKCSNDRFTIINYNRREVYETVFALVNQSSYKNIWNEHDEHDMIINDGTYIGTGPQYIIHILERQSKRKNDNNNKSGR